MASRRKALSLESFREIEGPEVLRRLGEVRRFLCSTRFPLQSPDYIVSREITARIDDMAELLTGDRTHFHLKGHSATSQDGGKVH